MGFFFSFIVQYRFPILVNKYGQSKAPSLERPKMNMYYIISW